MRLPSRGGGEAELLQRQGDEHELAFLESLKADGRAIVEIPKDGIPLEESVRLTVEAMTSQHRTGEAAMDQLQRERRFVDLFKVVSGAMIASEKGYSIKDLEAFYMEKRAADVATAGASVVFYEEWRQTGEQRLLDEIHDYNRTDCVSTQLLRDWLVGDVRPAQLPWPVLGEIPADGALSNVAAEDDEIAALRTRLEPVRARLGERVADLLLDLSQFHKREDKPAYWAIFDRLAQESEELLDDLECIQGLVAVGPPVQVTRQSFERTYSLPTSTAGRSPSGSRTSRPAGYSVSVSPGI